MTHAKGRKIRAIRIEEVMAEDVQAVGRAAEETVAGAAGMAGKAMKSARKCMNS